MEILPVSAVVPTRNRAVSLRETLLSLRRQNVLPAELVVVDASDDATTREMLEEFGRQVGTGCSVRWIPADVQGAAAQRNQGIAASGHPTVWFFDDDILFEPDCVIRLWQALNADAGLGGVNAMIENQRYVTPGRVSRTLFTLMHGRRENSFAGKVIGPGINMLPEDRDSLPEVVPVEWLNTTCTMYRREALPVPPFDSVFTGYSMMEDLTLSLRVGRRWRLANVRTARIFHDSQPGSHKSDRQALATMELVNRHYVMTRVLGRTQPTAYLRLLLWEVFQLMVCAASRSTRDRLLQTLRGKLIGSLQLWRAAREPGRRAG
jgi:glycosyltransferase involved in cell wall biosynthesis